MSRINALMPKYEPLCHEKRIILPKNGPSRMEFYLAKPGSTYIRAYISQDEDGRTDFYIWLEVNDSHKFANRVSSGYMNVGWGVFDEYLGL